MVSSSFVTGLPIAMLPGSIDNRAMQNTLTIATRESRLALWQAEHVRALLRERFGLAVELLGMTTRGGVAITSIAGGLGGGTSPSGEREGRSRLAEPSSGRPDRQAIHGRT